MKRTYTERDFAHDAMEDYQVYLALANVESEDTFKEILLKLGGIAKEQFNFWARKSGVHESDVAPSKLKISFYVVMRKLLGLTLAVRYIHGRKVERIAIYKMYCTTCTVEEDYQVIEAMANRMESVVDDIEEERVAFFSNIILGFNDALIELTGALVGFSFALKDPKLVTIGGFITGISASMSMAASAYLQARHEDGKSPTKAALFTGVAYFVIAVILVLPFVFFVTTFGALIAMFVLVVLMITLISFYSAILLERRYLVQLGEMLALSLGVAVVAFIIGQILAIFLEG